MLLAGLLSFLIHGRHIQVVERVRERAQLSVKIVESFRGGWDVLLSGRREKRKEKNGNASVSRAQQEERLRLQ